MTAVACRAPAKVNLRLAVGARREDGFHALDTVMVAVDLCDRVEASAVPAGGEVTLAVAGSGAEGAVPVDERNLAVQAARGVLALAGARERGLALRLVKEIPVEAGLGGGSSDAAAAAWAACRALGVAPDGSALSRLLASLGSDCPFFLDAAETGCARCTGRGEVVAPTAAPRVVFALIVPAARCSTAAVYAALRAEDRTAGDVPAAEALVGMTAGELRAHLANDLEPAALRSSAELARWRALLDAADCEHFRLSGSGSAFFGVFDAEDEAEEARSRVEGRAREAGLGLRLSRTVRATGRGVLPAETI